MFSGVIAPRLLAQLRASRAQMSGRVAHREVRSRFSMSAVAT